MNKTIVLINQILEEHKLILKDVRSLEQVANDAGALLGLESAREQFVPGRLDRGQSLKNLQEWLEKIEKGMEAHFGREETALLAAIEEYGDIEMAEGLHSLLLVHESLKNRFAHSRGQVAELSDGGLSGHLWEANANDMRTYVNHTRKLLEIHAEAEQKIMYRLRDKIIKKGRK